MDTSKELPYMYSLSETEYKTASKYGGWVWILMIYGGLDDMPMHDDELMSMLNFYDTQHICPTRREARVLAEFEAQLENMV